jgi:hypothetical protein
VLKRRRRWPFDTSHPVVQQAMQMQRAEERRTAGTGSTDAPIIGAPSAIHPFSPSAHALYMPFSPTTPFAAPRDTEVLIAEVNDHFRFQDD